MKKNIAETVGCEYEFVVIDNSKNDYSIFSAYNEGIRRARGNDLCFMHDDILYKTQDWGIKVEQILKDESIGFAGVIGSYVMTKDYGYWDMMAPFVTGSVVVNETGPIANDGDAYNDVVSGGSDVAILDGMWLCGRKNLFEKLSFDEQTYSGFHMYDMDICMQSLVTGYRNVVVRGLDIRHYSHAQFNLAFCDALDMFHRKWAQHLPVCCGIQLSKRLLKDFDFHMKRAQNHMRCSNKYWDAYCSISNSTAYKIGCLLLKPIYLIKKLISK